MNGIDSTPRVVPSEFSAVMVAFRYLYVSAASDLGEVFLSFERHLDVVVGHAEQSQFGRGGRVVSLGEHDELGHERHGDQLRVEVRGHPDRLAGALTVHQPESVHTQKRGD